jgi:hypothetical protein
VKIGEQLEADAAVGLGERLLRSERIDANVEDLDARRLICILVLTEPLKLVRSAAGETQRMKCEHHRIAPEFAQRDRLVLV